MKFLCIPCDEQMATQVDGIMPEEKNNIVLKFKCKKCGHMIAMLTNKFETEFVSKLGVEAGGPSDMANTPFGMMGSTLAQGKEELKQAAPAEGDFEWTQEAKDRIQKVRFLYVAWPRKLY